MVVLCRQLHRLSLVGPGDGFGGLRVSVDNVISATSDTIQARILEIAGEQGVWLAFATDLVAAVHQISMDFQVVHGFAVFTDQSNNRIGIGDRATRFRSWHQRWFRIFALLWMSIAAQQVFKLGNSFGSVSTLLLESDDVLIQVAQFLAAAFQLFLHKVEKAIFEPLELIVSHPVSLSIAV